MIQQESRKLVLKIETLARLQPESPRLRSMDEGGRAAQPTHPTTTVNTIHTGCC